VITQVFSRFLATSSVCTQENSTSNSNEHFSTAEYTDIHYTYEYCGNNAAVREFSALRT
jgi:hypothetical protein